MANRFYVLNCSVHRRILYSEGWAVMERCGGTDRLIDWYGLCREARAHAQRLNEESRTPYGYARVVSFEGSNSLPERFRYTGDGIVDATDSVRSRLRMFLTERTEMERTPAGEQQYKLRLAAKGRWGKPRVATVVLVIERT